MIFDAKCRYREIKNSRIKKNIVCEVMYDMFILYTPSAVNISALIKTDWIIKGRIKGQYLAKLCHWSILYWAKKNLGIFMQPR